MTPVVECRRVEQVLGSLFVGRVQVWRLHAKYDKSVRCCVGVLQV